MFETRAYNLALAIVATSVAFPPPARAAEKSLVRLRDLAPEIRQDIRYAGTRNFMARRLPGYRRPECLLRPQVAHALVKVQAFLAARKPRYGLKVFDCYRPMRAVRAMVRWTDSGSKQPGNPFHFPRYDKSELIARKYISSRSSHARGVAVDLTLIRLNETPIQVKKPTDAKRNPEKHNPEKPEPEKAETEKARRQARTCTERGGDPDDPAELDMGTAYDCFDPKSWTYAKGLAETQRKHRRALLEAMSRFGFRNYTREWWHFTFTEDRGGRALDTPVE